MRLHVLAGLGLACTASTALAQAPAAPAPSEPAAAASSPVPVSAAAPNAPTAASSPAAPQITYVFHSKMPAFQDKTAGATVAMAGLGSLGGLAGAAVAGAAGAGLGLAAGGEASAADAFPNPENLIGADVAKRVGVTLGATPAEAPAKLDDVKLQGSRAQQYVQLAGGSRYLVNVQTFILRSVWASYATWPLDFNHYIVEYMGQVTVFDAKESKELFKGNCLVTTKRTQSLPTHDELFANKGAILKTFFAQAADDCVAQLAEKNEHFRALVGTPTPPN